MAAYLVLYVFFCVVVSHQKFSFYFVVTKYVHLVSGTVGLILFANPMDWQN